MKTGVLQVQVKITLRLFAQTNCRLQRLPTPSLSCQEGVTAVHCSVCAARAAHMRVSQHGISRSQRHCDASSSAPFPQTEKLTSTSCTTLLIWFRHLRGSICVRLGCCVRTCMSALFSSLPLLCCSSSYTNFKLKVLYTNAQSLAVGTVRSQALKILNA